MDRDARHFVKLLRLTLEYFIREPAEKHDRRDCCRQAQQQREANELKQTFFVCGQQATDLSAAT